MIIKIFFTLGNDHPQILVKLEDCVLQAIISISTYSSHLSPLLKQNPPCHYPFAKDKTAHGCFLKNTTSKGVAALLSEY